MGNDIKLPTSQKRDFNTEKESDVNAKTQIIAEIERISDQVSSINNEIDKVEQNIKKNRNRIEYYTNLISEMSLTLQQIQMEQVNMELTYKTYVEKATECLENLNKFNHDTLDDEMEDTEIVNLEASLSSLRDEVASNDDLINKLYKKIASK